jgi:hypothetical protein
MSPTKLEESKMPINAKQIDITGAVTTIELRDDPSDEDLIAALDGQGGLATRGWLEGREVLTTTMNGTDAFVVGQPPSIDAASKLRKSRTLEDAQVTNIVKPYIEGRRPQLLATPWVA